MTKRRVLILVIAILLLAFAGWQYYKYRLAERSLHRIVETSKGLYSLHYDDLSIDEVGGSVSMRHVDLLPDTMVYQRLVEEKQNPKVLVTLHLPALHITGVKTPKALLEKELEGGKIEVDTPTIELGIAPVREEEGSDRKAGKGEENKAGDPARELARQLLGKIAKVKLDSVQIRNADISVRDLRTGEIVFRVEHVDFLLSDLLVDSLTEHDSSRILFSQQMDMACEKILYPTRSKRYTLEMDGFRYTSRNNTLHIARFSLEPRYSEDEFARIAKTQIDRYDFTLEGIRFTRVGRNSFWTRIDGDSLVVDKARFLIYHDRSYPGDTVSKVGKYPQQLLMKAGVPVSIRKAVFPAAFIEYKEKNPKSGQVGRVQFFEARGTITNITNLPDAIEKDDHCVIDFHAAFLRATPVNARLVLILGHHEKGRFTISGDLGSMEAATLNQLAEPMALARLEKGQFEHVRFDLDCNDSVGSGKVVILYKDLKVSLLKADKENDKMDKKGLASLAANMMIKRSNPDKKGAIRTSEVHYPRILNRSMFALIWKTIFTGVKECAGIKQ